MHDLSFTPVPGFVDNYFWLLQRERRAVVVDPGDARPVLRALDDRGLALTAIVVTHHHPDHVGGIAELLRGHPVPVFGPRAEAGTIPGLTHLLAEGDRVALPGLDVELEVWEVPGHTLGHIAYVSRAPGMEFVLCGDTLFKAGCGRLFEGTPQQMHRSLSRLAALPPQTAVYCTHEYTLANLQFAAAVEPGNRVVADEIARVRELRGRGLPSLPSTIAVERHTNPFLRCAQAPVRASAARHGATSLDTDESVFAALRRWKDGFRAA